MANEKKDDGILTKDEIELLLDTINYAQTEDGKNSEAFYENDFPDKCTKEQIRAISLLHEKFVRPSVKSLTAIYGRPVKLFLASTDQLTMGDFIRTVPSQTSIGIVNMEPLKGRAILEIAHPIDLKSISPAILESLREAWSSIIDLRPKIEKYETNPESINIVPRDEGVVQLLFETTFGSIEVMINFAIPWSVIKPVLKEFTADKINQLRNEYDSSNAADYMSAAEKGDADNQVKLAMSYMKGEGVPQDYAKGVEWLQKAAAQDNGDALHYLGILYKNGTLVELNKVKAIELFNKALISIKKQSGEETSETAAIYNDMGSCYNDLGKFQDAIGCSNKALVIRKNNMEEKLPETGDIYNNLGIAYYCLGQYDTAIDNFTKGMDTKAIFLGKETLEAATFCFYIAGCYEAKEEFNKALVFYNNALAIYEKLSGADSPDIANTCYFAANCYREQNNYEKALAFDLRALKIRVKICAENDPNLINSYSIIGVNYRNLGNYENALKFHFRTLELKKKFFTNKPDNIAFTLTSLGKDYETQGDKKNAQKYYKEALSIYKSLEGFENDAEEARQAAERNS